MQIKDIITWLREERPEKMVQLRGLADRVRRENVGAEVHLRGLIEFSNFCRRNCSYCGLRAANPSIERYRMCTTEIMDCVNRAVRLDYGTVVLQSGEDPGLDADWMADLIRRIKCESDLAVTLSLGERTEKELSLWRRAGADRYLLRFETTNPRLYRHFHPPRPGCKSNRLDLLVTLQGLGYEIGSGNLVGLPGQSYADLARDIDMFRRLDIDMIGLGPFIPHPATPLGESPPSFLAPPGRQVPATEEMTYKVLALTRLACPLANIPATTAVATLNHDKGFELGLAGGANVIMPNLTPMKYRRLYEIYPGKYCLFENGDSAHSLLQSRILRHGRRPGKGRGDSPNYTRRLGKEVVRKAV